MYLTNFIYGKSVKRNNNTFIPIEANTLNLKDNTLSSWRKSCQFDIQTATNMSVQRRIETADAYKLRELCGNVGFASTKI